MGRFLIKIFIITLAAATAASLFIQEDYVKIIDNDHYSVKYWPNDTTLSINCHDVHWINSLVKLDLPTIQGLTFNDCTFPKTTSVKTIIQSMNITINGHIALMGPYDSALSRRNLQGLDVPELAITQLGDSNDTPFDLFYGVKNVKKLEISRGNLIRIPEVFFADWAENITWLDLPYNKLRKIARYDFVHLVNMENLHLEHNEIDTIEPGAFNSLTRLNYLNLGGNKLQTLPPTIFHQLGRLTEIHLNFNYFNELSEDLFENTKKLTTFSMFDNKGKLKTLSEGFFKNLANLETVYIVDSHLESLPSDLFTGSYKLKVIKLSGNSLKSLPLGFFDDTRNLEGLDLRLNHLESLPFELSQEVSKGLQSIEHFDASNNNLTRVDSRLIAHLKSAEVIDLSHNQLSFESSDDREYQSMSSSVNGLPNGTITHTSKNETFKQLNFDPNVKLKRINLSNNKISQINTELMNILMYSESIDLSYNHISRINMTELLRVLPARSEKSTVNLKISLRYNPLHCDCHLIDFVRYLTGQMKNDSNRIVIDDSNYYDGYSCTSPPEFENHDVRRIHLEDLNCLLKTRNPDDACNGTCMCREYPAKQVLSVDCSQRNLTRLPPTIGNEGNWSIELNMTGNKLQAAPSLSGPYLRNVTSLNLSNNNISKVTLNLFSPRLQHLKLHGNNITRLDSNVIEYLANNSTLVSFTLHDNKWICDCGARQFADFVREKLTRYDLHNVKCNGTKRRLHEMTTTELCNVIMIISASLAISLAVGIVVVGFIALYLEYRRRKLGWLYYYM